MPIIQTTTNPTQFSQNQKPQKPHSQPGPLHPRHSTTTRAQSRQPQAHPLPPLWAYHQYSRNGRPKTIHPQDPLIQGIVIREINF